MQWHEACDLVRPYIVRIESQDGTGTGFLFGYNNTKDLCAVATAAHVVGQAHRWRQPISLIHHQSGSECFLTSEERFIDVNIDRDSASVVFKAGRLPFPDAALPLHEAGYFRRVGVELGWMGFPGVVYPELCFFRGAVSAFKLNEDCYLIDGVAINGVSGGPVFTCPYGEDAPLLVGTVSAYLSNIQGSRTLPGLARAQDISPFYATLQLFKNFDDAKKHEAAQAAVPPATPTEPAPEPPPGAR